MSSTSKNNDQNTLSDLQNQVALYDDQAAYKSLFFLLFPMIQNFAYAIVKSRVMAEEIASDILIELWVKRKQIAHVQHLKMYLLTSAKHAAVNKLKEQNKRARFSIDDLTVDIVSDYATPEQATDLHEVQAKVAAAVKALPASCQLIYKLAKEDRLRYKEIADLLNLSVKTIDNQLAIALKRIAAELRIPLTKKKTGNI